MTPWLLTTSRQAPSASLTAMPMDKRTLEFIRFNADDPSSHSGFTVASPNNEDLRWIVRHFVSVKRVE